ncbi:u3 small nucleolar ribonucleoprotein [Cyclospora cayetanensis]|uniref:U3 small nucleolar ribonucleoprotein n=1 Tax=Cyclospora cayetanensis TaxID=88456 RepID=A0A1D3CTA9_9EIME|nr:u3 small nucleolar ribonucleoprotein [Cyclospora cayetanensis]
MLRRTARLRKEYLYRKSLEEKERQLLDRKKRVKEALEAGRPIPTDIGRGAAQRIAQTLDLEDATSQTRVSGHVDDEYAYAGISDPKVVLTTCRSPSSRLQQFAKEFRLLIPNCQRINRGGFILSDLAELCRTNDVTDLLILHEHRDGYRSIPYGVIYACKFIVFILRASECASGEPDGLIVCHLPHGPTAHFSLKNVCLRHDLPEKPANMSEAAPHLIFHNFSSRIGIRVCSILKYLFPPSNVSSQRVHAFVNLNDSIHFRHYTWSDTRKQPKTSNPKTPANEENSKPRGLELVEVGPRFTLKPFRIELGTVEMRDLESEWALRPFFNSAKATLG